MRKCEDVGRGMGVEGYIWVPDMIIVFWMEKYRENSKRVRKKVFPHCDAESRWLC